MVIATDNLDLQVRRKRLGLNQRDIANRLPAKVSLSCISEFENGTRNTLPHGQGRAEYIALLEMFEQKERAR